jgi:prepilin-type processing-associated H-X9-DG protein
VDGAYCTAAMAAGAIYPCTSGGQSGIVVSIADVTDGTSNTACFSERCKGIGNNENDLVDPLFPPTTYWAMPYPPPLPPGNPDPLLQSAESIPYAYRDCLNSTKVYNRCTCDLGVASGCGSSLAVQHLGIYWWIGRASQGRFNTTMPPNSKFCTQGNENYYGNLFGTSSRHPGGVNMTFGDGSVKFIKNTVNPPVFWAIGSRNGGEVLNADQY